METKGCGFSPSQINSYVQSFVERVTAERDALQVQLNATDEHNDRLIAAINKVRKTVCLPASIEAVLIAALDRKGKTHEQ